MVKLNTINRLKNDILCNEINSLYESWRGCYTSEEYDFIARENLAKRYKELDWKNENHENMLIEMALDSHARKWKEEFKKGGWTRDGFCLDGLIKLLTYYKIWRNIVLLRDE